MYKYDDVKAKTEVEKLMSAVDTDNNGFIDYSGLTLD